MRYARDCVPGAFQTTESLAAFLNPYNLRKYPTRKRTDAQRRRSGVWATWQTLSLTARDEANVLARPRRRLRSASVKTFLHRHVRYWHATRSQWWIVSEHGCRLSESSRKLNEIEQHLSNMETISMRRRPGRGAEALRSGLVALAGFRWLSGPREPRTETASGHARAIQAGSDCL